ncbi:unnamed protein product [Urochloa humidicola]
MAPPRDSPSAFVGPELADAVPFELIPAAVPTEVAAAVPFELLLPAAVPSEVAATTVPSKSLTTEDPSPQPTSPWLNIRMPHPHSTDAPTSSIPRAADERCALPFQYRLARLSTLAARASTASSSRTSTSPRCHSHRHQGSSSPSLRVV